MHDDKQKSYCEFCNKLVYYYIESKEVSESLKEKKYIYNKKIAYCSECNNEIAVNKVRDYNLSMLYNTYRVENDLVSLKVIREIPKKYNIGIRPLSLLLGWGELTYTRYFYGYVPILRYSDIIKKIHDYPEYYLEILEKNKDNISRFAYDKSKYTVSKLITNNAINKSIVKQDLNKLKILYIIALIKEEDEDITFTSIQNVLYFLQGFNYAFEGMPLFNGNCEAYYHGVLCPFVNDYLSNNEIKIDVREYDSLVLNSLEFSIVNSVIKFFCCYSSEIIKRFVIFGNPWKNTVKPVLESRPVLESKPVLESRHIPIDKEYIKTYFLEIKDKYKINTPMDIKNYTNQMFESVQQY